MDPDYTEYLRCVEKIKSMAGLVGKKSKSIRESLRDDSFEATMDEAVHCRLFEFWSLREQQVFLEDISPLSEIEKRVRIHEMAFSLYKLDKFAPTF
jgi:hypothetical protein